MADNSPWYMKYGTKIAGAVTALLCCALGIFSAISITAGCIVGGILLILIGIVVFMLEVPFCFAMIPQLHKFNEFMEKRSPLQRAIFYGIATILPMSMCFGVSTIICGLALAGMCAFHIWQFVLQRRARARTAVDASKPSSEPVLSGAPGPQGETIGFRDHFIEKVTAGAARGAASAYPSGTH